MSGKARIDPDRVAAYIRWSTEDQGEGHTLEVQREHCMRVFRDHGWTWQEALVFVDAGYSGTVMDRPALTRLRQAVRGGLVDCVVVYRLDRLSRRTSDTLVLIQDEWEGLCHFVSATEPISTVNGMSDIVLPLLSTIGEMDRNRIISNTRAGKYAAAAKGRPMGKLPYGYRFAGSTAAVEIDPVESEVVRRIFREYLRGVGQHSLTRLLNQERIPSPEGKAWSQATIGRLLQNEAYVGRLVYAARVVNPRKRRHPEEPRYLPGERPIVVDGAYPPLVSAEVFEAAARLRRERGDRRRGRRGLAGPFLLSRLARCARCGCALVGVRSSSGLTYYACQGSTRHRAECDGRLIRQDELEERVLGLVRLEVRPVDRERLLDAYRRQRGEAVAAAQARLAAVEARLQRTQDARKRWSEAFEQGLLDAAAVGGRLAELAVEENEARAALEEAARASVEVPGAIDEAALIEAAESVDVWARISQPERKHLIRCFVREVQAYAAPTGERCLTITLSTRS